jgi:hypothetical protein
MEILDLSLSLLFLIGAFLSLVPWLYLRLFSRHSLPSSIPWAGVNDGSVFSRARSTLRSLLDTRGLLNESYTKVCRTDPAFQA